MGVPKNRTRGKAGVLVPEDQQRAADAGGLERRCKPRDASRRASVRLPGVYGMKLLPDTRSGACNDALGAYSPLYELP